MDGLNVVGRWSGFAAVMAMLSGAGCGGDDTAGADAGAGSMTATDGGSSGGADGSSGGSSGGVDDDDDSMGDAFAPGEQVLPRLTQRQYRNAVADLLGEGLPTVELEADTNPYLFYTIGAASTSLSELGAQQYEEAADILTSYVWADVARRDALVACTPAAAGDACVSEFLDRFGKRAFRRPLSDIELQRWLDVSEALADDDPWRGVRLAVAGMLQSPYFLYRVELGEVDPEDPTRLRYTGYDMASRLSFLLWDSIPDDALLAAAEAGTLSDKVGIESEARRLLADPRARGSVQAFFGQYFDLGRLNGVTRDPQTYPAFTASMVDSMRTEVELLVDDVVYRQDTDVRSLFSTRTTFVNTELAELYGIEPPPGASAISFAPAVLPEDGPRAGMLTLGAFLTMNAHETETSPTLRGKYLRERVLCMEVPAPPDDADTNVPEPEEGGTLRERLEAHRANPACASCHAFIDPPGYLFENFDSAGGYRTLDNGFPVDASGDLDGIELANARELADVLATNKFVGPCVVKQLFRHASSRLETDSEEPALEDLSERFEDHGHRFSELLIELVTHESFRYVAEQTEDGE